MYFVDFKEVDIIFGYVSFFKDFGDSKCGVNIVNDVSLNRYNILFLIYFMSLGGILMMVEMINLFKIGNFNF